MTVQPLLEMKHIRKTFSSTVALGDVSLNVYPGEVRGLIGENGSGKSTISSIAAEMQKPDSGEMIFMGSKWNPKGMIDALDKVLIGLDFFDASINRIAAWVIGARNAQKALLWALLQPDDELRKMQDNADFTGKMMLMEEVKTLPFGDVWEEYCARQGVPADKAWYDEVTDYERRVLVNR